MDASQWPQVNRLIKPMEEMASNTSSKSLPEKRSRPQKEQALNCPRCNSANTKFCYYNNYSLRQPRYFCKSCRRYWTDGGTLRNVPVGGGSRKNKRPSSSFSSNKKFHDLHSSSSQSPQDSQIYARKDLNMSLLEFQDSENRGNTISSSSTSSNLSSIDLIKNGLASRCVNPFMLVQNQTNVVFNPTVDAPSFKPMFNFPLDGSDAGFGNIQDVEGNNDRFVFPFEDLKQVTGSDFQQNRGNGDSSGFWNGMLGGGSW